MRGPICLIPSHFSRISHTTGLKTYRHVIFPAPDNMTGTSSLPRPSRLLLLLCIFFLSLSISWAFLLPAPLPSPSTAVLAVPSPTTSSPAVEIYQGFWDEAKAMMDARQATLPWQCLSIPADLQRNECTTSGKGKRPDTSTVTETYAYAVPGRIRQARAAILSTIPAVPPKVLNFVVFPEPELELPIFGADFVALPGGHLIVLDFQPVSSSSLRVAEDALKEVYAKYKALLPPIGGEIPEAARSFFSPYFLFVRAEDDELVQTVVFEAFRAYFSIYLDLVEAAKPVPVDEEGRREEIIKGHKRYATYRAVNDPARGMLTRMYGEGWTERLIYEVLFDQAERKVNEW